MRIQIDEVKDVGTLSIKTIKLTVLETNGNPYQAVRDWINKNRPELSEATARRDGYHAYEL